MKDITNITTQELKDMIAGLAISSAKTDAQLAKTDAQLAKTDAQLAKSSQEFEKQLAITDAKREKSSKALKEQIADTNRTLKALGINIDGINKSNGLETEEFFYSSLSDKLTLGGIKFDSAIYNLSTKKQGKSQQIDTFLENGSFVGVVEVKNKVKMDHLKQLQNIVDNFYFFHPVYKGYKIIPAIAGKIFPEHIQKAALEQGFVVLTQKGDHIEQIRPVLS
jgi:hypothetical protein